MTDPTQITDAHMHLWDVTRHDWYPALRQMADQLGNDSLFSDFGIEDYRRAAGDLDVCRFVHVSATTKPRAYLEETPWVCRLADEHDLDLVVIGTVDPTLPSAEIVADLEQQAEEPRFRGIRVLYDLEPGSDATRTVLTWLEANGKVFDLVTQPDSMPEWLETLSRHPDLSVALEHTGWPAATDVEGRAAWLAAITECARRTRAVCKVSGLGMTTLDLSENALRPWVEQAVTAFGWERVAFGSNIPIEHLAGAYAQLQSSLATILAGTSSAERESFYGGNAARLYGF